MLCLIEMCRYLCRQGTRQHVAKLGIGFEGRSEGGGEMGQGIFDIGVRVDGKRYGDGRRHRCRNGCWRWCADVRRVDPERSFSLCISFCGEAANRRRETKGWQPYVGSRTEAKGTRQTRGSPTHSRHCTSSRRKTSAIMVGVAEAPFASRPRSLCRRFFNDRRRLGPDFQECNG